MSFAHATDADRFAQVDVPGDGGGAGVKPAVDSQLVSEDMRHQSLNCVIRDDDNNNIGRTPGGAEMRRCSYQSIDCGGSSFECEVLTVSTQPIPETITSATVWYIVHCIASSIFIPIFALVRVDSALRSYLVSVVFLVSSRRRRMH